MLLTSFGGWDDCKGGSGWDVDSGWAVATGDAVNRSAKESVILFFVDDTKGISVVDAETAEDGVTAGADVVAASDVTTGTGSAAAKTKYSTHANLTLYTYQPYFIFNTYQHWKNLIGESMKAWEKLHILHWNAAQLLSSKAPLDSESMLSRSKRSVGASTFGAGETATDSTFCGRAIEVRCGALRTGIFGPDASDFSCNIQQEFNGALM
jgi:hypothetical protein